MSKYPLTFIAFLFSVTVMVFAQESFADCTDQLERQNNLGGCSTWMKNPPSGSSTSSSSSSSSTAKPRVRPKGSTNKGNTTPTQETRPDPNPGQCNQAAVRQGCDDSANLEWADYPTCGCVPKQAQNPESDKPSPKTSEDPEGGCNFQARLEECKRQRDSANSNCDADTDSGISAARDSLKTIAVGLSQQVSAQNACSGLAKGLGAANAAVAAFTGVCSDTRTTCVNTCSSLRNALERDGAACYGGNASAPALAQIRADVREFLDTCNALDTKIQQGVAAVNNTIGSLQGAQSCANQLDVGLLYCKQNPTAIGCDTSTDCNNAVIANSSPICYCSKGLPPSDPRYSTCNIAVNKSSGTGTDSGNVAAVGGGLTGGTNGGINTDDLMDTSWKGDPNWKKGNTSGEDPGGSKGGRPLQDGTAGNPGGPDGGGGAGGAANQMAVNSGFRGGAGGGSGGGFYGGGGGGGAAGGRGGSAENGGRGPDLRQFLPGGKYDPKARRGIAGLSGPDGITGPYSNIWQKIQNRYQAERVKLIP